jgi:hypothetical protein
MAENVLGEAFKEKTGIPIKGSIILNYFGNGLRTLGQKVKGGQPYPKTTRVILDNISLNKNSSEDQVREALRGVAEATLKARELTALEDYNLVVDGMVKRAYATTDQIHEIDPNALFIEILANKKIHENNLNPTTPLTSKQSSVLEKPLTSKQPSVLEKPLTSKQPSVLEKPLTSKQPSAVGKPLTKQRPSAIKKPLTKQHPAAIKRPVTKQRSATIKRPVTNQRPATIKRLLTKQGPSTIKRPLTKQRLAAIKRPLPKRRPFTKNKIRQ